MEVMHLSTLAGLLILTGCQGAEPPAAADSNAPKRWNFNFFTPRALPALVTFVVVQDANGTVYRFNTLNSTFSLDEVVGGWNNRSRTVAGHWNHVESPPKHIIFCWDSVIDKKVYETHLAFSWPVVDKMRRPSAYKNHLGHTAYYNNIQIGLAPEGKVAVWLRGIGFEPNYRVTPSVFRTLSGDKLEICKGITRFSHGYEYGENTKEFIKGKTYPYGNW